MASVQMSDSGLVFANCPGAKARLRERRAKRADRDAERMSATMTATQPSGGSGRLTGFAIDVVRWSSTKTKGGARMRDKQPRPSVRRDPDKGGVEVMACVFSSVFLVCGILFALWFSDQGPIVVYVFAFAVIPLALFLLSGGVFLLGLGFGRITLLEGGVLESRILLWKRTIRVSDVEGVCRTTGFREAEISS